jgi:hypothetical protein
VAQIEFDLELYLCPAKTLNIAIRQTRSPAPMRRSNIPLGTRITDEKRHDAIAFAELFNRHITVAFNVVHCVLFPPVQVAAEQKLPLGTS